MKYDGMITIATGNSRRSTSWKNKEMLWSDFVDKLSHVTRTQETQAEYACMPKDERDNAKDVGGFVGGTLKGGRRKIDAITQRRLITLDMDSIAVDEDPWPTVTLILGCAAVLYSTHSHTPKAPRFMQMRDADGTFTYSGDWSQYKGVCGYIEFVTPASNIKTN